MLRALISKFSFIIVNVLLSVIYSSSFIFAYKAFLFPNFEYAGFTYQFRSEGFVALTVLIAALPVLIYRGYKAISSFICVFIYIILYIPIVITYGIGSKLDISQILSYQITFMVCMTILFFSDRINLGDTFLIKTNFNLFKMVLILTILGSFYMLFKYRSNIRLVSFAEVYELRSANEDLGGDFFTRYFSSWLSTVLIPLCLAFGIVGKRPVYFIVGSLCCLIFYMTTAAKGTLLFPVIYLILNFLLGGKRIYKMYSVMTIALSLVIIYLVNVNVVGSVSFIVTSLLLMRTIGNGGMLTMWYDNFFLQNSYTYYSHINIVNFFTKSYPYGEFGVGQVIGKAFWSEQMNANANFWATDGIAALGLTGVVIVSLVFFFIFIFANAFTQYYNRRFLALVFVPFIYTLLNQSLFSTMWSGGGFFLIMFFSLKNSSKEVTENYR